MNPVKIIEVKESVLAGNDREADQVRAQLKKDRTFLVNLMAVSQEISRILKENNAKNS